MVKLISISTISDQVSIRSKVERSHVKSAKISKLSNRPKKSERESWVVRYFKEFAANTALHGYNHIVREDSTKWERIAWIIIVLIATVVAVVLLFISFQMNSETPTITVIESTHYPISNVFFPAVTICNMNSISAKQAMIFANKMTRPKNVSPESLSKLFQLLLHFQGIGTSNKTEYDLLHSILQANNISVGNLTTALKPTCNDMIKGCRWKGSDYRCDVLFQAVTSIEGICCSFNFYATAKSTFPPKVAMLRPKDPRRTSTCGHQTGLVAIVSAMSEDYRSSFFSSYGLRVLIHDAYDFPDDNAETKAISTKMLAYLMVYPETTYSTPDVRKLAPNIRYCYFHDERKLNYFQRYTHLNCLAECRSEIAHKICKCVPYFLPNNGSYRVCEMDDMMCIRENRNSFFGALPGLNKTVLGPVSNIDEYDQSEPCGCLPDCELNQYPTELTSATLNRTFSTTRMNLYKGFNVTDHTSITVFFADLVSTHYRRDIYQNWLSLLASFGGILGLLLGFSFVAGFELIYFFTIRVFFDRLETKKNQVHRHVQVLK